MTKIKKLFNKIQHQFEEIFKDFKIENSLIESSFRILLTSIQPFILGNWLRFFISFHYRKIVIEIYVIAKTILLYLILKNSLYKGFMFCKVEIFYFLTIYFICETLSYNLSLIFASENFLKTSSYRRKNLLLLFNYVEIVFGFAILYYSGTHLNDNCKSYSDALYFSFVTSATIGYGDIYPVSEFGKNLVIFQSIVFLIFVMQFLGFSISEMKNPQYKESKNNREN